jgi:hypothetical protein
MKKVVFAAAMALCLSISVFAQSAETQKNYVYCELLGIGKFMSNKLTIQVDFGQKTSFWKGGSDKILKDENGGAIVFNSMVDAMNYFGAVGWEFVQAYVVTTNNQHVYHWLLKKEITAEEAKEVEEEIKKEE